MAMTQAEAGDIASRTKHFRNSLIEEFRLSESEHSNGLEAPKYSSGIFRKKSCADDVLRHNPHTLIKFKIFKRSAEDLVVEAENRARRTPQRLQRSPTSLPIHEWAKWISAHPTFSNFMVLTILLNAAILGMQTFHDEVEDWQVVQTLEVVDHVTVLMFVLEILLKWISDFRRFWKDGWNIFDFCVTAGSLGPLVAQALVGSDTTNAENIAEVAKTLKVFRTFRTLKMIAKFRSLRIIVRTIMEALQSLAFVLLLLFLLMYIFAILAIGLFSDYSNSTMPGLQYQDKFVDMITAVRTLFQLLTLDQWYNIAKEISTVPTINKIVTISFFIVWVALGAFIFRNIFIGVMVKNFQSISQELAQLDHASRRKARIRRYAKDLHEHLDHKKRGAAISPALNAGGERGARVPSAASTGGPSPESPHVPVAPEEQAGLPMQGRAQAGRAEGPLSPLASPKQGQAASGNAAVEAEDWQKFVADSLQLFKEQEAGTTLWPRDTLLEYLQTMERLQENMKEYQELQHLAALALYNIVTD